MKENGDRYTGTCVSNNLVIGKVHFPARSTKYPECHQLMSWYNMGADAASVHYILVWKIKQREYNHCHKEEHKNIKKYKRLGVERLAKESELTASQRNIKEL